jgi:hypothetical protein
LIRELVRTRRPASYDEVEQMLARMATAPFLSRPLAVPPADRGAEYQGKPLGRRADSGTYHLVKRVVIEEQWADGTTLDSYLNDLRRAVRDPSARLVVFERRGGALAATVTPTERVLTPERRGAQTLPHLLVIYSADRGMIVTGYQFSAVERVGISQEATWHR